MSVVLTDLIIWRWADWIRQEIQLRIPKTRSPCLKSWVPESLSVDQVKNTLATNLSVLSKAKKQKTSCRSNDLQKICLGGTNTRGAARLGCLGSAAHTRMSWLLPGHSNGSCLHWTGLNSRPSWPPLHAICGMAAAETLKGGSKQAWSLRCCYLFPPRLRVAHSCAAGSAYDLLRRLVFSQGAGTRPDSSLRFHLRDGQGRRGCEGETV